MAKINTLNYQTVASWNGSQDLFIVEQPDGTKVATPAMVKQFIEAGDFEATGEVKDGHGNILADMAKSADVAAEIGDLSETGLTGDSVAEQLSQVNVEIGEKIDSILTTYSPSALNVDDTFQIPSAMLDRKILIISANRAAWAGSVIVTTGQIKAGDCGNGVKIVTGDRSNPTVDKYIVATISQTGLITIKYINNWSAPYLVLNAI